jgi:AcrR family transcriptional regulator
VAPKAKRSYQSTVRKEQAQETRRKIALAARRLLTSKGYAGATIDAIASEAGVSAQTVYSIFGSKTGIIREIIDEARFSETYRDLVRQALENTDPVGRLRFAAKIARQIRDAERSTLDLLRGAGVVAPELARIDNDRECERYEAQTPMIDFLIKAKRLRPGLDREHARDILWTLTGRELYRMLVRDRRWTSQGFEDWLGDTLVAALLSKR